METKTSVEELRKPHPNQERIDSESARLLRSTAQRPGGRGAWIPAIGGRGAQPWPAPEPIPGVRRR